MKFCDKIILISVCIILLAVLHYVLPIINKLLDGKEGMTTASQVKNKGGVLTDKKRTKVVKPTETITNNGDINGTDSGLPEDNKKNNDSKTGDTSYHVHYHINSNDPTNITNPNLKYILSGDVSQDFDQVTSQFSSLNETNQEQQTSEFTSKYPCRSSITGMFTDCGPQPGNMECYSEFYGNCIKSE